VRSRPLADEGPTLALLLATYAAFALGTTALWGLSPVLALGLTALAVAQQSSLTHEALHGHPFADDRLNHALVYPALGLFYPYGRFRDLHLAHHHDPNLTDPYDDPESNFQDPAVWARTPAALKALYRVNNTLLGRMVLGTAIGVAAFVAADLRAIARGDRAIRRDWLWHAGAVALVLAWLLATPGGMPVWGWLVAAYAGNSLIKIRTFLEHRAHEKFRARTVIVEGKGPLAWLFLFNSLHVVHHCHPNVAWHRLPALYAANREHYLRRNEAYVYPGYAAVFAQFLLRAKDPVPHPVWPVRKSDAPDAADQAAE
jgi:fatty acid desaturase